MNFSNATLYHVERVVNLLRENPENALTVREVADSTGLRAEDAHAYLEDLAAHHLAIKEIATNGVGRYCFASAQQRGA